MSPLPPLLYLPSALTLLISYTIHRSRHLYTQAQTPPLPPYYTFPIHSQWHVNIQAIALIFIPCTYIPEKQYIEIVTWTSVLVLAYVNAGKWGRWKRWVVVQWVVGLVTSLAQLQFYSPQQPVIFTAAILRICFFLTILTIAAYKKQTDLSYHFPRQHIELPTIEKPNEIPIKRHLLRVLPFIVPKSPLLILQLCVCILLLVTGRVVNFYVPFLLQKVIYALTVGDPDWKLQVFLLVVVRSLQGNLGALSVFQSYMWIPIEQAASRNIAVKVFTHLHELPLQFHLHRKTGEVMRVMDRGTSSIVSLLGYILFNIAPVIFDIVIAILYFSLQFDMSTGLIVGAGMSVYLYATIRITEWRTEFRRIAINLENEVKQRALDSLLNYETVKYFSGEEYEADRFEKAVHNYQKADKSSLTSLSLLNTAQTVITMVTLLACTVQREWSAGEFVLLWTWIVQLYTPLGYFGSYWRALQQNFVDMEKLVELLDTHSDVVDKFNAPPLVYKKGHIKFENVAFSYDGKVPVLHDISFEVQPGTSVALVGTSGGGKSTITRLLFRFYDINSGSITIDGQNIGDVSQSSLRRLMGVVPQDTILFNASIKENLLYGRPTATDDEVVFAAKAARIHEKIMTFPKQYETVVGERGLRLSGGEKQRVAIARIILKNPEIVLMDEATSALDSTTERGIQESLLQVTSTRTTLIIAHRLSTIEHVDQILVVDNGYIVERGTHDQLLAQSGVYHRLYHSQSEEAQVEETTPVEEENIASTT